MPPDNSYKGQIAQQLDKFQKLGMREASYHRPASDAEYPDSHEVGLRSEAEQFLSAERRKFDEVDSDVHRFLTVTHQDLIDIRIKSELILSNISFEVQLESVLSEHKQTLIEAAEERIRADVDYKQFKGINKITEPARYPESHIWHFSIILLLALIETGINSVFFENNNGLLGGLGVATGVAVINMGSAGILGYFFRYKNLRAIDKRLLGWGALAVFLIISFYCNSLFAAFRSEYQVITDPGNMTELREAFSKASERAVKIFIMKMNFYDLMSFILFGFGLMLSFIAFWKGYTFDDRYPGYGDKDRELKRAKKDESDKQVYVRNKVNESLISLRENVRKIIHEPSAFINLLGRKVADLKNADTLFISRATNIQRDYHLVLDRYRQANVSVRGTPQPSYFTDFIKLINEMNTPDTNRILTELNQLQESLKLLHDELSGPLNAKLTEISNIGSQVLNEKFPRYLYLIDKDAQNNIDVNINALGKA